MEINKKPLVSIIINCFNGEKFLDEALKSLLQQTYENCEIIFWDNQSTDSSAKIFKKYQDRRFKYFFADEHTTLSKARNLAIEKSKGDLISFLDADDLWEKNKLELQIKFFEDHKVGAVFSNHWVIKKEYKKKLLTKTKLPRGYIYNNLIDNYVVGMLTIIIKKNFYLKLAKKFDERFSIIEDYDLILRLSKICVFECIEKPLASYRLHEHNHSKIHMQKEIKEMKIWLSENKLGLKDSEIKKIKKQIDYRELINYKIEGKYKKCLSILLNSRMSLLKIKGLIIFLTPKIILKRILWFY